MHDFLIFLAVTVFIFVPLTIGITISLENRSPHKTISWLLVLMFLPGVGFLLYLIFGANTRKHRWENAKARIVAYLNHADMREILDAAEALPVADDPADSKLFDLADQNTMRLVLNSGVSPLTVRNKVDIYTDGVAKFAQMLEDIKNAREHIHLEYYIIRKSSVADELRAALISKANEGVKVRIIYDDWGSWKLKKDPEFILSLKKAGCEVYTTIKPRFPFGIRDFNYRDHRKICVIDGKIGYVGGINIADEYIHKGKLGYWRDTHLRIQGAAVYMLQMIFAIGWMLRTDEMLLGREYFPTDVESAGESMIQIAASGADTPQETIYQAYFYAIAQAKNTVYIETPYFIPDESILTALKAAAMAGVDVRIIFPQKSDHATVHEASLSYLEELMRLGAKVYFYQKGFIHSKMLLVDNEMASVGTANMDIRSFMLNSEINAFIYDNETVGRLYRVFADDLTDCRQAKKAEVTQKFLPQRIWRSVCRLFSPVL